MSSTLSSASWLLLWLCLAYLFFLILVLLHELGHYLWGRLVGLELHSLRVGPFEWLEKKWIANVSWGRLLSGWVKMSSSPKGAPCSSARFFSMVAAGPITSATVLVMLWATNRYFQGIAAFLGGMLVLESLLILISCLLPVATGLGETDGKKMLLLVVDKHWREDCMYWINLRHTVEVFRRCFLEARFSEASSQIASILERIDKGKEHPERAELKEALLHAQATMHTLAQGTVEESH